MVYKKELGKVIRTVRNLRGITQRELAEKLKVTENYIWMVENGRSDVSQKMIEAFSAKLQIPRRSLEVLATEDLPGEAGRHLKQAKRLILDAFRAELAAKNT